VGISLEFAGFFPHHAQKRRRHNANLRLHLIQETPLPQYYRIRPLFIPTEICYDIRKERKEMLLCF